MNKRLKNYAEAIVGIIACTAVISLFFYKTIFSGLIPFPGDILVSEYQPWKSERYLGYVPGSYPNKAQYPDTIRQLYPWRTLVSSMWKKGQAPLWNPYSFSGTPLLANFQSAAFYPLNFISVILPQVWSWTILIILQPVMAMLFTFLYCRKMNLGKFPSFFGAITYAFSDFMTVWLEYNTIGHVIVWLPLALFSIEKLRDRASLKFFITLVCSYTFALFAGHPQVFFYMLVFTLFYSWYRKHTVYDFIRVLTAVFLGFSLGAVQLLPGLELIAQSARSPHPIDLYLQKILIQPWQLIMLLVPDFFGNPATRSYWLGDTYIGKVTAVGIMALIFSIFSLRYLSREKIVRFFIFSTFVIFILVTANPISSIIYRLELPVISSSSPTLSTFLIAFSLAILAAYGAEYWQKQKVSLRSLMAIISPLFIVMILLWLSMTVLPKISTIAWASHLIAGKRSLLFETLIFAGSAGMLLVGLLKPSAKNLLIILVIIIQTFDLFISFRKFNPFVPTDLIFPKASVFTYLDEQKTIDRFWGHAGATIEPNFSAQYFLFSPEGYDPLYIKNYGSFIQSSADGKIHTTFTDQTRSDAVITPSHNNDDLENPYRLKVLDLLGTKYVLDRMENGSSEKGFPPNRFSAAAKMNGWTIFQNINAVPRFFLASSYEAYSGNTEFENKFFQASFNSKNTILVEKQLSLTQNKQINSDTVSLISYQPNEVIFQTETNEPRLLFLSDNYYPGWQAYIDGQKNEILKADYTFRTVIVPKGSHKVRFIFRPLSFTIGASISLLSFLTIMIVIIFNKHKNYA